MSFTSVDLPLPETPVTTVSRPSGNSTSMFFRLCSCASPLTPSILPLPAPARGGAEIDSVPAQILAGQTNAAFARICAGRSLRHQFAAEPARPGPRSIT